MLALPAAMRVWQEQMLKSRQLVLAQQAKSAVQQANKAQREVSRWPGAGLWGLGLDQAQMHQVDCLDSAATAALVCDRSWQGQLPGQQGD